ncbi:MAG: recombinase family protein, partial [Thaumarchaeota archaeon]|nr:recombinase family protein [Nitrososphaerota archaeon]
DNTFVDIDDEQGLFTAFKAYSNRREATKASPRIKDKLAKRAEEGGITHGVPYGFKNARMKPDGAVGEFAREGTFPVAIRDPKTFRVLDLIAKLFIKYKTFLGVARALNKKCIPSPEGGTWGAPTVKSILVNRAYRGELVRGRVTTLDKGGTLKRVKAADDRMKTYKHPELVAWDAETVKKIDLLVKARSRVHTWGTGRKHLASGLVRCVHCGTGITTASSNRSKYQSYCCAKAKARGCVGIGYKPKYKVDAAVVMACQSLLTDEILDEVITVVRQTLNVATHASTREIEIDRLNRDVKLVEKRVANLTEAVADTDSKDVRAGLFVALQEQQRRLGELQKTLDEAKCSPVPLDPKTVLEHMEKRIKSLRAKLSVGGIEALPAVLSILGEERFIATKTPDGWAMKARVSSAFLFAQDDG